MAKMTGTIDETDRRIIKATQGGLPLVAEPYGAIADDLGLTSVEVMERMERMLASGVIRRMGAVPNHYKLGVRSNAMTVWDVVDDAIAAAGREIGALGFVSHCYHRPRHLPDWPYNLFAMVHGRSRQETEAQAEIIAATLGSRSRANEILYSTRILKKTGLRLVG